MAKAKWLPPNPDWQRRANQVIAQGCLTNSKHPRTLVQGIYPTHLKKGFGAHVEDVDGNSYIDFICGLGSSLFGYANSEINGAIFDQLQKGTALSLATDLELRVAEKIEELFPFIERMKFLKTGSDACSAAIKIARAYTKKEVIVSMGYHGWHDDFVSLTPPALGVPKRDWIKSYPTDPIKLEGNTVAAVIIEAVQLDASPEYFSWVKDLIKECHRVGVVVIFDEVITGFRFPKYSASGFSGLEPDLICLGKAMGGGLPLSSVAGREEIMNCGEYFVSSTFAGETLSLAACLKVMEMLQGKYRLEELWERGQAFLNRFNKISEKLQIKGYPTRGSFQGDDLTKALFWQEACKAGLLFGPSWFYGFQHMGLNDIVLATCEDILMRIEQGQIRLAGQMPSSPFAAKVRGS